MVLAIIPIYSGERGGRDLMHFQEVKHDFFHLTTPPDRMALRAVLCHFLRLFRERYLVFFSVFLLFATWIGATSILNIFVVHRRGFFITFLFQVFLTFRGGELRALL